MRGARIADLLGGKWGRIIPADAGSTYKFPLPDDPLEDHPRGCGEHAQMTEYENEWQGSSPRMRGAHHDSESDRLESGIIPADAGSTTKFQQVAQNAGDHPRGCGEHP